MDVKPPRRYHAVANVISGSIFAWVIKRRCDEDSKAGGLGVLLPS